MVIKYPELWVGLVLLFFVYQFSWSKSDWQNGVLSTDGRGYYAYLPSIILFQDLSYEKNKLAIEEQLGYEMSHHCILEDENGKRFNKTFPGVSLMQLPLFLVSIVVAWLAGFSINGYSEPFLIGIQLSAWWAAIFGFYALRKSMKLIGLSEKLSLLVAVLTLFATNVFYYATAVPSMGHIYSFMLLSWFLYASIRLVQHNRIKNWVFWGALLGIIALVRPTNIVVVVIFPFIWQWCSPSQKIVASIWANRKHIAYAMLTFMMVVSLLPILWKIQTGNWLVWSYTGEGFYWLSPQPFKVLFSFRNGLFIWTPLALLSLVGFWYGWKNAPNKFSLLWLAGYFLINLYIISAWWTHYYGGGFGHRVYVDHQFFTALLFGLALLFAAKKSKVILMSIGVVLGALNMAQAVQVNKGIIPQDYMNAEMYALLFLKFDDKWKGECHAILDAQQFGKVIHTDYPRPLEDSQDDIVFDANRAFGGDVHYYVPQLSDKTALFLEFTYEKYRMSDAQFNDVFFVVDGVNANGETVFYEAHPLYHIRSEAHLHWKPLQLTLQLPNKDIHLFKLYVWNLGQHAFKLRNLDVRIHHIQP